MAVGGAALYSDTSGVNNTGVGSNALYSNTNGAANTSVGYSSLYTNSTGLNNTALGYQSLYTNATTSGSTAVGYQAGYSNTTGSNSFFGYQAGYTNAAGTNITAIGYQAMRLNSSGTYNTALGYQALQNNSTASYNTAMGASALGANTTGQTNTAIGQNALGGNTAASGNTAVGQSSMSGANTGNSNSAFGASSLSANTSGAANVAIGQSSMIKNTTGNANTVVGLSALNNNLVGNNKTAIGYQAGSTDSLGGNNTFLGYQADNGAGKTTALTNATAIGYQSKVNTSNSLALGGIGANAVNVGIGTASPSATLDVIGKTKTSTFQLTTTPTAGYVLTSDASGNGTWQAATGGGGSGWGTTGTSGTSYATNFIGTTDNKSMRFRTNNIARMIIDSLGRVGVGTANPTQKFQVSDTSSTVSIISATTNVLGQYENTNKGGTSVDLKTTNVSHTLTTRIGINPTYTATGGTGVMAWYANYDGNYKIIHMYDYVNNNYFLAPNISGFTVAKVGVGLSQASLGSLLTVGGGIAVSNGATTYATTAAPAGGAIIEGNVGIGTTAPTSTFEVNGSVAAAITTTTTNLTLDATNYTVIITGSTPTITLPAASTCNRRIYVIVNQTGTSRTITSYKNLGGTNTTTIATVSSIMIQSNGTNWYQIK